MKPVRRVVPGQCLPLILTFSLLLLLAARTAAAVETTGAPGTPIGHDDDQREADPAARSGVRRVDQGRRPPTPNPGGRPEWVPPRGAQCATNHD